MDLGHWQLAEGLQFKQDAFGFIYEICCLPLNKKYIGKKQCVSKIKRKPLKGKTRNRIEQKQSDWKTYTGSSKDLNEDIEKYGKDSFTFTILDWGGSKWELGYKEIKQQIEQDVILSESFYNGILNVRIGKPPKTFNNDKNVS
jgi:hypothetical protein